MTDGFKPGQIIGGRDALAKMLPQAVDLSGLAKAHDQVADGADTAASMASVLARSLVPDFPEYKANDWPLGAVSKTTHNGEVSYIMRVDARFSEDKRQFDENMAMLQELKDKALAEAKPKRKKKEAVT